MGKVNRLIEKTRTPTTELVVPRASFKVVKVANGDVRVESRRLDKVRPDLPLMDV